MPPPPTATNLRTRQAASFNRRQTARDKIRRNRKAERRRQLQQQPQQRLPVSLAPAAVPVLREIFNEPKQKKQTLRTVPVETASIVLQALAETLQSDPDTALVILHAILVGEEDDEEGEEYDYYDSSALSTDWLEVAARQDNLRDRLVHLARTHTTAAESVARLVRAKYMNFLWEGKDLQTFWMNWLEALPVTADVCVALLEQQQLSTNDPVLQTSVLFPAWVSAVQRYESQAITRPMHTAMARLGRFLVRSVSTGVQPEATDTLQAVMLKTFVTDRVGPWTLLALQAVDQGDTSLPLKSAVGTIVGRDGFVDDCETDNEREAILLETFYLMADYPLWLGCSVNGEGLAVPLAALVTTTRAHVAVEAAHTLAAVVDGGNCGRGALVVSTSTNHSEYHPDRLGHRLCVEWLRQYRHHYVAAEAAVAVLHALRTDETCALLQQWQEIYDWVTPLLEWQAQEQNSDDVLAYQMEGLLDFMGVDREDDEMCNIPVVQPAVAFQTHDMTARGSGRGQGRTLPAWMSEG